MLALAPLPMGVRSPGPQSLQMSPRIYQASYSSDGDALGVFNFAGQGYAVGGTWANPSTSGNVVLATSASLGGGTLAAIVDRSSSDSFFATAGVNLGGLSVDLGFGRSLIPNKYTFRQRVSGVSLMTGMKLQGSNDAINWTDLTTADLPTQTADVFTSFPVSGVVIQYRYLRIQRTLPDSSGGANFCIGEWELYGTLFY